MDGSRSIPGVVTLLIAVATLAVAAGEVRAHLGLDLQIREMDAKIEAAPRDAELYARRAELLRLHGQLDDAARDLKRARRLDPSLAIVDLQLGRVHLDAERPRHAERALSRFLERVPTHAAALVDRARARSASGRLAGAVADYDRAIELTIAADGLPRPSWYIERARTLAALGDEMLPEAIRGLDAGLATLGEPVTLQLEAIELELRAGDFDGALERLRREAGRTPRPESWLERIGEVQAAAGRLEEAAASYRAALEALERVPAARRGTPASRALETRVAAKLEALGADGGTSR